MTLAALAKGMEMGMAEVRRHVAASRAAPSCMSTSAVGSKPATAAGWPTRRCVSVAVWAGTRGCGFFGRVPRGGGDRRRQGPFPLGRS